ncbi:hypothetical protein [Streptomyces collinus]|uniref:hypothetical protein n=1 Tax=Streptomyces collinus TaxID=42684 RepID=UPI0036A3516D
MTYLEQLIWNYWMDSGVEAYELADKLEQMAKDVRKAEEDAMKSIARELGFE